jgi:23S rRNA-/tRNA-specific pseudouridylate synthase
LRRTDFSAAFLAKSFRSRSARKIYWALVPGVPKPKQGRVSTYLAKEEREDDSIMRVAKHGEEGASQPSPITPWSRRGAEARLAFHQARHGTHAPAARPDGAISVIPWSRS